MDVNQESYSELEAKLRTILPDLYQDCYEEVQPVSMGSASLKYGPQGEVAWDEMWDSFCDLAMAGGPPHKGTLLMPATQAEIDAQPEKYQAVVDEICRGIELVSDLKAKLSKYPGWIRVPCDDALMAEWLVRAIVMENVSAHWKGTALFLPASPSYTVEKGIKNVVTVIAKTCHYWVDHMWLSQQHQIAKLFAAMAEKTPLVQPSFPEVEESCDASSIYAKAGFKTTGPTQGWLGIECASVNAAIWLMRGMVVSNVLARREGSTLLLPSVKQSEPTHERILQALTHVVELAHAKGIN